MTDTPGAARLDKVLARAGLGSRRICQELIAAGRVTVEGVVVVDAGAVVDPEQVRVMLDGEHRVHVADFAYLVLHKPPGVVATMHDQAGRSCLGDFLSDEHKGLFHVGRLDVDSAGLQLLMNDGELAHRLTDGSHLIRRTYLAQITGTVPADLEARLRAGVDVDGTVLHADSLRVVVGSPLASLVEVVEHEGGRHVVRKMLAAAGHPVRHLVCTGFGPVRLGTLAPGECRALTAVEVENLRRAVAP